MLKLVNQMSILVCILTLNLNHAQPLASQRSDFFFKKSFSIHNFKMVFKYVFFDWSV